jgi:hypothetical protein
MINIFLGYHMKSRNAEWVKTSKIISKFDPSMRVRSSIMKEPEIPFLKKYTARLGPNGAAVWDGKKLIASCGRLRDLIVHEDYRGKGIGTELVVQWRLKYPELDVKHQPVRTEGGAKTYKKAFNRLYPDKPIKE